MFVNYDVQTKGDDFNRDGTIRISSIIEFFETASCKHSDLANDNLINDTLTGKAWIMTDWFLFFENLKPKSRKLSVKTWIENISSPFSCTRNYELYSDNEVIVKAVTKWVIVDLSTNRLQKIDSNFEKTYQPENKKNFQESKLPKLIVPEIYENEVKLNIRRSDIDYNNHVHNLVYLDYAFEALPKNVYELNSYKSLRICYKHEVKANETIICKYSFTDNKHVCCIFDDKGELKTQIEFGI